ncbi:MAG: hypothetical protein HZA90_06150 [Verrucomicrobia bacterium]|nr:hypothetical protein [Verrucomicrobiota bacterium]
MTWTLTSAAVEFGVSKETLKRGLGASGIEIKRGKTFSTREIVRALHGDLKFERTRRERAEANKAEIQVALLARRAMPVNEAQRIFNRLFLPVREAFLAAPALASLVNPGDPEHARQHLENYCDQCLKLCREFKFDEPETV